MPFKNDEARKTYNNILTFLRKNTEEIISEELGDRLKKIDVRSKHIERGLLKLANAANLKEGIALSRNFCRGIKLRYVQYPLSAEGSAFHSGRYHHISDNIKCLYFTEDFQNIDKERRIGYEKRVPDCLFRPIRGVIPAAKRGRIPMRNRGAIPGIPRLHKSTPRSLPIIGA